MSLVLLLTTFIQTMNIIFKMLMLRNCVLVTITEYFVIDRLTFLMIERISINILHTDLLKILKNPAFLMI